MSESTALKRILVLDDDADFRALLRTHLGKLFDHVDVQEYDPVARGAPSEDFDWSRYDVLILDYYLCIHNLTGLDILQANRKNKFFPAAIMLTGAGSEEVAVRAVKAGVYDYLRKEKLDKEQLKRSILNAFEQHKDERQRLNELTNQSLAFNKALFYQELESSRDETGKDRVLLLIQLDDEQMLEQRLGGILRDNIVRHIARRSFEVFQVGDCHPHITRLGDAAVAMLIDSPDSRKTLDFNMNGLCTHLKKRPYKFDDKKFRFTVSIGVVEIPRSGRTADRLIQQARKAAEIAVRTEGNSFHFFRPEDEPAPPAEPAVAAPTAAASPAATPPELSIDADLVSAIDTIVEEPPEPPPPLALEPEEPAEVAVDLPNLEPTAAAPALPGDAPATPAALPPAPKPELSLDAIEPPAKEAPATPAEPKPELGLEPIAAPGEPPSTPAVAPPRTSPTTPDLPLEPLEEVPAPKTPTPVAKPAPPARPAPAAAKRSAPVQRAAPPAKQSVTPPVAKPAAPATNPAPATAPRPAAAPARPAAAAMVPKPVATAPGAAPPAAAPKPASDEIELDDAALSETARAVRKAFEEKRVVQTFQPVIPLFSEEGADVPEVYRVRLQLIDRDGSVKAEDFIYTEASTPNFQKFIDRWLLRETIGRVVNNPNRDQVFIIRISEPSLADPGLFNWLRKLLAGLDKQRPGKSIALEMSAPEFTNQQKKAAALIAYLGKSQGFRFVLAQVREPEQAQPLAAGQADIELLKIGTETLQKLKTAPAGAGQTGSMFDGIVGKGVQVIAEGIEDATTLTNVISAGAHYAMGNFIGEAVQHLEDSTNVESFEIT